MFLTHNGQTTMLCQCPTSLIKEQLAKADLQIWIDALTEELEYRDLHPEYHK